MGVIIVSICMYIIDIKRTSKVDHCGNDVGADVKT